MVSTFSALATYWAEVFDRYTVLDLGEFFLHFSRQFILPLAMAVCVFGGFAKLTWALKRWIVPPPPPELHQEALAEYRRKKPKQALKGWTFLAEKHNYVPSVLALACHEIYVTRDTKKGLEILQQAQKRGVKLPKQQCQSFVLDAKAIAQGNLIMVDMNAKLAKQDYLGITS